MPRPFAADSPRSAHLDPLRPGALPSLTAGTRRILGALLALVLALGGVLGATAPAQAAPSPTPSAGASFTGAVEYANNALPGTAVPEGTVLQPGTPLQFHFTYSGGEDLDWSGLEGQSFEMKLGGPIAGFGTVNLKGNEVVSSFEAVEGQPGVYRITFKDEIPKDVAEGHLILAFTAAGKPETVEEPITWDLGAFGQGELNVVVKGTESKPAPTKQALQKKVNGQDSIVADLFDVSQAAGDLSIEDRVRIKDHAAETEFSYTLNITALEQDPAFAVEDLFPEGLVLVPGSLSVSQTKWASTSSDAPIAVKPVPNTLEAGGTGLSGTVEIPGVSETVITYKLKIKDQATLEAWREAFIAQIEADESFERGKSFDIDTLTNTATLGPDTTVDATVEVKDGWGNMASINPGGAFGKSVTPNYVIPKLNADGTLAKPRNATFTLSANLRDWDGSTNLRPTLKRNVVISDRLASPNFTWDPAAEGFIRATGIKANDATGSGAADLQLRRSAPAAGEDFAADKFVGTWYVDAATNTLHVNVGTSRHTNARVEVAQRLVSVEGLTSDQSKGNTPGNVAGEQYYHPKNTASFSYTNATGSPASLEKSAEVTVVDQREQPEGAHDENRFSKTMPGAEQIEVVAGQRVSVPFTITAKGIKGFDLSKSTIVDYVDTDLFDVSDLGAIRDGLVATYDGRSLPAKDFTVEIGENPDELKIGYTGSDASVTGKDFTLKITLETFPVYGKLDVSISNRAVLFGEDGTADYWDDVTGSATNYGFEAQVAKQLYVKGSGGKDFTSMLQPETENGELVQRIYVYRIKVTPRGGYANVSMRSLRDRLPAGTSFVGFVADDDMDEAAKPVGADGTPYALSRGNLEAVYVPSGNGGATAGPGDVMLRQKAGTVFPSGQTDGVWVNLALSVDSSKNGVPVVNTLGASTTSIVPTPEGQEGLPLAFQKLDALDASPLTDRAARFSVQGTGEHADFSATAFVEGGYLVTEDPDDADGAGLMLRVPGAGEYTITELTPPTGYEADATPVTVKVNDQGVITSRVKALYDTPIAYALGDYVWVDGNKNGLQDDGEQPLEGVTVTLLDELGNPALDLKGKEVKAAKTDANGRYLFDGLKTGSYRVHFALTPEQARQYSVTKVDATGDDLHDSDGTVVPGTSGQAQTGVFTLGVYGDAAEPRFTSVSDYAAELGLTEGSKPFTAAGGIDQSRDLGVHPKDSVSVGDRVWFDQDKDGVQSGDATKEPGLPGVVLEIVGPDGKPVKDVFGDRVKNATTDKNGYYTFENLPVLEEGKSYTVKIVRDDDSTKKALAPYLPTQESPDAGRDKDSSTWEASSEGLNQDGERDDTLDFGFVLRDFAVGDRVWIDVDRDGVQDENEPSLDGVKVSITGPNGETVKNSRGEDVGSVLTSDGGRYLFDELPAGKYIVHFDYSEVPADRLSWPGRTNLSASDFVWTTAAKASAGTADDSDADRATGATDVFTLGEGSKGLLPSKDYTQDLGKPASTTVRASDGVNPTVDAGLVLKSYAVGDHVWIDADRDGVQGKKEKPLAGVTVSLSDGQGNPVKDVFDAVVDPVQTDEHGWYAFDELPAGEYVVTFSLNGEQRTMYRFTQANAVGGSDAQGGGTDASNDSDAVVGSDRAVGASRAFTLDDTNAALTLGYTNPAGRGITATQGIDPTWDAGVVTFTYAIGDKVWFDNDREGDQGEGEGPVPGVTVKIFRADQDPGKDEPLATTVTNNDGTYFFDGLPEGDYVLKFELPEDLADDYTFTTRDTDGVKDSEDSDVNPRDGLTTKVTLGPGNTDLVTDPGQYPGLEKMDATEGIDPTWDAGLVKKAYAVGDIAWIDTNRDGLQQLEATEDGTEAEPVLEGVTVEIFSVDEEGKLSPVTDLRGREVAAVTTDENGRYLFDELPKGRYQVKFTLSEEQAKSYTFTKGGQESGGADDSDADRVSGLSQVFELNDNNSNLSRTYEDQAFKASQGIDPTWDAGVVVKSYAIGDVVWFDENRDGAQGENPEGKPEPAAPGVTVTLLDADGKPAKDVFGQEVEPVVTDEFGRYLFQGLPAGDYTVRFELPEELAKEYAFTTVRTGDEGSTNDSDADRATGLTRVITLGDNNPNLTLDYEGLDRQASTQGVDPTWDAGLVKKSYAIGDRTWIDTDKNGVQDQDEPNLPGVTVTLLDAEGQPAKDILGRDVAPVVTDEFGRYLFDELAPGTYTLAFQLTPEQAKRYQFTATGQGKADTDSDATADADAQEPGRGLTALITLGDENTALERNYKDQPFTASQGVDPTWDAGVIVKPSVSVGDYVWVDTNRDGRQDEGEPGIPGVTLTIAGPDGKPVTDVFGDPVTPVVTGKNGEYTFENLPVLKDGESYTVRIDRKASAEALKGYLPTKPGQGDRAGDSSEWEAASQGLTADGDRDDTLDFGFVLPEDDIDVGGVQTSRPVETPGTSTPSTPGGGTGTSTDEPGDGGIDVGGVQTSRPVDAGQSNSSDQLSSTGLSAGWMGLGLGALALLVLGALTLVTTRRRARRH